MWNTESKRGSNEHVDDEQADLLMPDPESEPTHLLGLLLRYQRARRTEGVDVRALLARSRASSR
jgi:hypothetical protein